MTGLEGILYETSLHISPRPVIRLLISDDLGLGPLEEAVAAYRQRLEQGCRARYQPRNETSDCVPLGFSYGSSDLPRPGSFRFQYAWLLRDGRASVTVGYLSDIASARVEFLGFVLYPEGKWSGSIEEPAAFRSMIESFRQVDPE